MLEVKARALHDAFGPPAAPGYADDAASVAKLTERLRAALSTPHSADPPSPLRPPSGG
jgi:hypothetical protein